MSNQELSPQQFDKILCSPTRLAIITLLFREKELGFTSIREKTGLTDGNLSINLRNLEEAGYVKGKKSFFERKPLSTYKITTKGQKAFAYYVKMLEEVIKKE